jgi:hypothetical protein
MSSASAHCCGSWDAAGDGVLTVAMLDRILHHSIMLRARTSTHAPDRSPGLWC